jgi:hypothetical protein
LTGDMTGPEIIGMSVGKPFLNPHALVPSVSYGGEMRIKSGSQCLDHLRQWIGKVLVFSTAKTMASHFYMASESAVGRI